VGGTLYFLHGDHLGSATLTTDASGNRVGELRYTPYGVTRYEWGNTPTNRRYTGQRQEQFGLYDYRARYYSPLLGRFVSADTLVPSPGNPQSLNRYSYCLGNPLKYTDPSGHAAWVPFALVLGAAYLGGRVAYEAASVVFIDSDRRDQIGGQLVMDVSEAIQRESASRSVDSVLISAVLRHESAAFERRLLTLWPTMRPGVIANTAEFVQSQIQGDIASIGPGQMQLRRARELEELGYVTARKNDFERRLALLDPETSVEYVAGMLQYLTDRLSTLPGFGDLSAENQRRVILIGYNWGWESLRDYLEKRNFRWWRLIQVSDYDNQTLDEYVRWSGGR
jgi:RHS repeat-associated protein